MTVAPPVTTVRGSPLRREFERVGGFVVERVVPLRGADDVSPPCSRPPMACVIEHDANVHAAAPLPLVYATVIVCGLAARTVNAAATAATTASAHEPPARR